jgi:hypothetical protein
MPPSAENGSNKPQTWSGRIMGALTGPTRSPSSGTGAPSGQGEVPEVLPPEDRKAAMTTLDQSEAKWTLGALILATVGGIAIPLYFVAENKVTKDGKNSISVAPDAKLLGAVILVLCAIGFAALWKRKRTLVAFDLFLIGFAFTLFIGLLGFVFILLGGFLMLRAWRLNKYGTTNSKVIAREAAARPRGRQRKEAARSTSKKSGSTPPERRPPTASKRYTPKSAPRKKIPKPTE